MFGKVSQVWKEKVKTPMFGKVRSQFQCLEIQGENLNVWKDRARTPVF